MSCWQRDAILEIFIIILCVITYYGTSDNLPNILLLSLEHVSYRQPRIDVSSLVMLFNLCIPESTEIKGDSCCSNKMSGTDANGKKQADSSSDRGGDPPNTPEASQDESPAVIGE